MEEVEEREEEEEEGENWKFGMKTDGEEAR